MSLPSASPVPSKPQSGLVRIALIGAVALVVLAGGAFYYATTLRQAAAPAASDAIKVTIRSDSCDPNELTVPAGTTTFEITNASDRAVEWEILDGVMVVEERENIAPGFNQSLSARLQPGDYAITCGLLSNPRGVLHVTPSAAATAAAAAQPTLTAFIGPLAEYKVFLTLKANAFAKAAGALADAVKAGDVETARALYPDARAAYGEIEAEASRYADLNNSIDGLADYLARRENDPAFTGLHRIEYGLFANNGTEGLGEIADSLIADAASLQQRLKAARTDPADLGDNAQRLASSVAAAAKTGEDHYAETDLAAFAANLDAIAKIAKLLGPVAPTGAKDVVAKLDTDIEKLQGQFEDFKQGETYASYANVSDNARKQLAEGFAALADDLSVLNDALGLS